MPTNYPVKIKKDATGKYYLDPKKQTLSPGDHLVIDADNSDLHYDFAVTITEDDEDMTKTGSINIHS